MPNLSRLNPWNRNSPVRIRAWLGCSFRMNRLLQLAQTLFLVLVTVGVALLTFPFLIVFVVRTLAGRTQSKGSLPWS